MIECTSYLFSPRLSQHVDPVKADFFHASAEVLLVPQEDLAEVAHAAHKHPEMDVQLVEATGQVNPKH